MPTAATFDIEFVQYLDPTGKLVRHCGIVTLRQQPETANGTTFVSLEDETGVANLVIWPKVFEQNRRTVLGSRMLRVDGRRYQRYAHGNGANH